MGPAAHRLDGIGSTIPVVQDPAFPYTGASGTSQAAPHVAAVAAPGASLADGTLTVMPEALSAPEHEASLRALDDGSLPALSIAVGRDGRTHSERTNRFAPHLQPNEKTFVRFARLRIWSLTHRSSTFTSFAPTSPSDSRNSPRKKASWSPA